MLKDEHYNLGIITSRQFDDLEKRIAQTPLHECSIFDYIITSDTVGSTYRAVKTYLYSKNIDPRNTVLVDDLPGRCAYAKRRGSYSIGVLTGLGTKDEFTAAGISDRCIVNSVADVPSVLKLLESE